MVYVYGGFLKWWYKKQPLVFLLKMISTWGVKWGYHHVRKHPYMYCQTAKPTETNPFASQQPRPAGRSGVAGLHLHRRKVVREFGRENVVCLFPPLKKKKGEAETQNCCPYVVSAILGCFEFLFYISDHMNPLPRIWCILVRFHSCALVFREKPSDIFWISVSMVLNDSWNILKP